MYTVSDSSRFTLHLTPVFPQFPPFLLIFAPNLLRFDSVFSGRARSRVRGMQLRRQLNGAKDKKMAAKLMCGINEFSVGFCQH